jgi:hypothetical protein
MTINILICVGLFENGRIGGFRNLRINDAYDFLKTVRPMHQINYFVPLLRRDRQLTPEDDPPQVYVSAGCQDTDMFELQSEDL